MAAFCAQTLPKPHLHQAAHGRMLACIWTDQSELTPVRGVSYECVVRRAGPNCCLLSQHIAPGTVQPQVPAASVLDPGPQIGELSSPE